MTTIDRGAFAAFFESVTTRPPFPWQIRLASALCDGTPLELVGVPTGCGKSSLVHAWCFALAYQLSAEVPRTVPMRLAWVVDRRLVIDDVYESALDLREKLLTSTDSLVQAVSTTLASISGNVPLQVARLRGGIPREGDWAESPVQPTVVSSTIDQIGSRLLFRGYGVRQSMRPIHAGLLGEDTLIALDEPQIAEPFRQTLQAIGNSRSRSPLPWRTIAVTATPRHVVTPEATIALDAADLDDPILSARLNATKPTTLVRKNVEIGSDEHVAAFVAAAKAMPAELSRVLIVVNRVTLARNIFNALAKTRVETPFESTPSHEHDVFLMMGRTRGVDAEHVRSQVLPICRSGVADPGRRVYIVATQTIEVGADIDADALVTQIAPLDVLQQRFGRLNRLGRPIKARATVLAVDQEILRTSSPDPIYGEALGTTWKWLLERAQDDIVDFGLSKLKIDPSECATLIGEVPDAPVLMSKHIQTLSRTSPPPIASPDQSLYLHGAPTTVADVSVVIRADYGGNPECLERVLAVAPIQPGEALALTPRTVRRWLALRSDDPGLADADARVAEPPERTEDVRSSRTVLRIGTQGDRANHGSGNPSR